MTIIETFVVAVCLFNAWLGFSGNTSPAFTGLGWLGASCWFVLYLRLKHHMKK